MNRILHSTVALAVTIAALAASAPVLAQEAAGGAQKDKSGIEEVLVTAEKRSVDLQKVPLAISAVTNEALDQSGISNVTELTGHVPGLVINKSEGTDRTITLRGLGKSGSTQNGGLRQSVAYHVDGVYFRNTLAANQDFFDVERVEIIRGPTGTVYGQSSIGGVINVITKRPKLGVFNGHGELSAGERGSLGGRFYVNAPLTDTLALRASIENRRHDGYSRNVFLDVPLDEENNTSSKVQLLWKPSANFDVLLRASRFDIAPNNGHAQKSLLDRTPGTRNLNQNFPSRFAFKSQDYSAEIKYSNDFLEVKSLTAYQDAKTPSRSDNDRDNFAPRARPGFLTDNRILNFQQDRDQFSQEVNVTSKNDSRFQWLVGAYYLKAKENIEFIEGLDNNSDGFIPDWDQIRKVNEALLFPDNGFIFRGKGETTSLAFFGNVSFALTDQLDITGGVRTSQDKSKSNQSFFFGPFAPGPATSERSTDFKIGVNYDVTDHILAYLTYATGSKPNGGSLSGTGGGGVTLANFRVPTTFKREKNKAIEVGVKARALDNRLQINSAFYRYKLSDYQFLSDNPIPFGGGVVNAPDAKIWGLETEITALLSDSFRVEFAAGYTNAKVSGFAPALDTINANIATAASARAGFGLFSPQNIAARQAFVEDLNGSQLPAAPKLTLNVSGTYDAKLSNGASLEWNVNYTYRDKFFARIYNHPIADPVPSQGLVGASVTYKPAGRPWSLALIGTNLTNNDAINNTFTDIFGIGATGQEFSPPRVVMVRFGVDF